MPAIIPTTHHYGATQGDEFPEYTQIEKHVAGYDMDRAPLKEIAEEEWVRLIPTSHANPLT